MIPARASSLVLALLLVSVPGCTAPAPTVDRFPALGTLVEVTLHDVDAATATAALRALRTALSDMDENWSAWGDGALAQFNAGSPADPALAELMADAETMATASGRLFEPRIGALVELWGFHDGERRPGPPPDADAIQAWLDGALPVRVDLGAYAKGAALTRAAEVLREHGISNALVNAGGDIVALGDAGNRAWHVGIRHPRTAGVLAGITLADGEAVLTSGDYERTFEWADARYHHILDPRTGRPAPATASITVIARDAAHADAAATALFVAGEDWPEVAAAMGVDTVLRVAADGRIELSAAMAARVDLLQGATAARIVNVTAATR